MSKHVWSRKYITTKGIYLKHLTAVPAKSDLLSGSNNKTHQFFDSLGLGLRKILLRTHEEPYLLNLLKRTKWSDSTVALQTQGTQYRECGAFVGTRAFFGNMTNKEFVRLFKGKKADKTVVMLTLLHYIDHEKVRYNKNDRKSKSKRWRFEFVSNTSYSAARSDGATTPVD